MRVCFSYVCVSVSEEYVCMCECFSSECVSVSVVSVRVFHRCVCESVSISYVLNGHSYCCGGGEDMSITVVHQVAQINEAKIDVRRSTAFLKMRRGEISGSAPLKEPGASKKRLKNGTPRLLDSACAAITSYQVSYRIQSLAA